jgi:hypothetical protein
VIDEKVCEIFSQAFLRGNMVTVPGVGLQVMGFNHIWNHGANYNWRENYWMF